MTPDYDFESSDILGGVLPVGRGRVAQNSGFSAFFKVCALGASTLFLLLAFRHGRTFFLRWKERHYKLSMRRRYGIPDHDQRPFNVAYAAARLAQEDKKKVQDQMRNVLTHGQPNSVSDAPTSHGEGYGPTTQQILTPITLQVSGHDQSAKLLTKRSPLPAGAATQPLRAHVPSGHADVSGSRVQPENGHADARDEGYGERKPASDHIVHDSGIDVDSAPAPRRSKRLADSSEDSDLQYSQENRHDKRRRKGSGRHLKKRIQKGDDVGMNGISEIRMSRGGKKRDRTEMDSSFGPDDDILYNDQDTDFALHRHRRRRQRKSTNLSRGQKRGRDVDSLGVDTDSGDLRGRKAFRHLSDTSDTDPSVEGGQISRDPLCRGRRIGEEWEAHGVLFRVGLDGQRLRRVLVKEDRPKFNMPVDSEHPDRSASVTAIVERWYSEEQYMAAKKAHELAWQDSDRSFAEPDTPADHTGNSSYAGKQLLWASTPNTGSPVRRIRISSHSSIASPRMVPFPVLPPPQYTRRVSSLYSSSSVKPTEMSPKLRSSKSYSKWEKQEIEAEAIARLRRKAEEKEKAKAEAEAKEAEAKKAAIAPAPSVVSLTMPDEKPSAPPSTATPAFSLPTLPKGSSQATEPSNPPPVFKISAPSSSAQSNEAKVKPEARTSTALPNALFSFPSASAPTPTTQTSVSAPTASGSAPTNSAIPNFFTQSTQPTTAPSSAPDAKGPASSLFSFGQPKATSNNPIANASSASQGNGSNTNTTPQGFFSFSQLRNPSTSTSNTNSSSHPSTSTLVAGGTSDASKPKFNFGVTSKPTSVTPPNPPNPSVAPTSSGSSSKPVFSFGMPKGSSGPTTANPFSSTPASSTTTTQVNQPSVFGTSEGKSTGVPTSGVISASSNIKADEGTMSTNRGQSTGVATGESTSLFGNASAGTQTQDGPAKPSSFAPASGPTMKPLFSFGAGSGTSTSTSGTKQEPGNSTSAFSFNANPSSSIPTAVPPTPGSVFSDSAAKTSQSTEPIVQPLFGAPKTGATSGASGFSFGQSSAPFSFGSFGTQKS